MAMITTPSSWVELLMPGLVKITESQGHFLIHDIQAQHLYCPHCGIVFGTQEMFEDDQISTFVQNARLPCDTVASAPWGTWSFAASLQM